MSTSIAIIDTQGIVHGPDIVIDLSDIYTPIESQDDRYERVSLAIADLRRAWNALAVGNGPAIDSTLIEAVQDLGSFIVREAGEYEA